MSEELKRCPFCGGEPKMYYPFHLMGKPGHAATYHGGVRCSQCGCESKATTPVDGSISSWNARAALPSDAAQAPLTDDALMAAIASVCAFDPARAEKWRPGALAIGRAVERAVLAAPVAPAAAAPINLEGLRKKLLTPRKILRDECGWLWHMDYPVFDEGTRADKFLEALGIEPAFVSMESDLPDFAERWHEEGLNDCSEWTPTPPAGDGWLLLEIYDTEDGPYAMFGRDQYEAENALKRKRTRELSERIQQRQATQGGQQ